MNSARFSVARLVVLVGLAIQIAGLTRLIFVQIGGAEWLRRLPNAPLAAWAATFAFVGSLALIGPVIRGRRWAQLAVLPLQIPLIAAGLPFFLNEFAKPGVVGFSQWLTISTLGLTGAATLIFAVIAALEVTGRMRPVSFIAPGGGVSREAVMMGAFGFVWLGMVIAGYAAAATPSGGASTFSEPPVATLHVTAVQLKFTPQVIALTPGTATALFLTNGDPLPHSFDVDALGVHVAMPAKSTVVAVIKVPAAGTAPYYCGVPGHEKAGMAGTITVR
ncbi:MAG TPA: cupredoxin domain-containing protein [bacterium]|jgi:plastocyanin